MPDPNNPFSYVQDLSGQELMGAFTPFEQQNQILMQQLARARALREAQGRRHSTGLGAALGGLGEAISGTVGAFGENAAMEGQKKLSEDMQREATNRVQAIIRRQEAMRQAAMQDAMRGGAPKAMDMAAMEDALPFLMR